MMREKPYRSIVKAISWRAVGTIDTILIAWLVVGKLEFAVTIGGVELFTKMALYYLHERTWNKIRFGRVTDSDMEYQI
ncbi:MAG: DUF2061 domain-containing protein [Mangrovibacterium sp.]